MTYRVSFDITDGIGVAHFVRHYEARDSSQAHSFGLRDLMVAHPDLWHRYAFREAVQAKEPV